MYRLLAIACSLALFATVTSVEAANCPGRPAAFGTGRVVAVDPTHIRRIGTMQYPDTLPLRTTKSYSLSMTAHCHAPPQGFWTRYGPNA
jgi:hypothetical protein